MLVAFWRWLASCQRGLSIYWLVRAKHVLRGACIRRSDTVLDVGCAAGLWSLAVADSAAHVVGLDVVTDSIGAAKSRSDQQGRRNTSFVVASATAMPFRSGSFDKLLCIDVLDIIPQHGSAAAELARVMNPGGRVVVTVLLRDRRYYLRPVRFAEHIRNYTREELSDLLHGPGLVSMGTFDFYRMFSTIARELADIMDRSGVSRVPGIGLLVAVVLTLMARLDVLCSTPGGGFGIVAIHHRSSPGDSHG